MFKNYRYEEPDLLYKCPEYTAFFEETMKHDNKIKDSHDVVSHWMIHMNID